MSQDIWHRGGTKEIKTAKLGGALVPDENRAQRYLYYLPHPETALSG